MLWLPGGFTFFFAGGASLTEKRQLAPAPDLAWEKLGRVKTSRYFLGTLRQELEPLPGQVEAYFADRLVLKPLLLRPYASLHLHLLGRSPMPTKVLKGRQGWYFLGDHFDGVISESLGMRRLDETDLARAVKHIRATKEGLQAQGIAYYLAVAPNKHTVYSEHLFSAGIVPDRNLSRLDSALKAQGIGLIYLGAGFEDKKATQRLYFQTDSHWTPQGAYEGYKTLIDVLRQDFPAIPSLLQYDLVEQEATSSEYSYTGDLTRMLGLPDQEPTSVFQARFPRAKVWDQGAYVPIIDGNWKFPRQEPVYYLSEANDLRILVLGDSYAYQWVPLMAEAFGHTVMSNQTYFAAQLIDKVKPDIVLHEVLERGIDRLADSTYWDQVRNK
jgi:hypothetical protein